MSGHSERVDARKYYTSAWVLYLVLLTFNIAAVMYTVSSNPVEAFARPRQVYSAQFSCPLRIDR